MADRPVASSEAVRRRMGQQRRTDTAPELLLRRALFSSGARYRVNVPVPEMPRRTIDIAFTKRKVAIFVDGCFWHSCPQHGAAPHSAEEWWREKLARNVERDRETDAHLEGQGWRVLRFWEHTPAAEAASQVLSALRRG